MLLGTVDATPLEVAQMYTGLANGGRETKVVASEGSWEGLRSAQECGDARAHLSKSVEDTVQDDEEREDSLDGAQSTTDDETEKGPQEEAQSHSLLASNAVHEQTTDNAAGEVEAVDNGLERVS